MSRPFIVDRLREEASDPQVSLSSSRRLPIRALLVAEAAKTSMKLNAARPGDNVKESATRARVPAKLA